MNDRCLVSRFAENCTQQNIRYIEDLNSAHTQTLVLLDYWLHYSEKSINDVSKAQSSKLKIFHHNCNTEITPSVLFYLLFLPSHGLVITQFVSATVFYFLADWIQTLPLPLHQIPAFLTQQVRQEMKTTRRKHPHSERATTSTLVINWMRNQKIFCPQVQISSKGAVKGDGDGHWDALLTSTPGWIEKLQETLLCSH